jgi:progressive ankylosis protein
MTPSSDHLGFRRILAFWAPLAATWLMMSVEGPYVAAIIARLANPTVNLAAYGVAFSLAFVFEAPIIMVMTASNALVGDRHSFLKLRRFVYVLNAVLSGTVAVAVIPPLFRFVTDRLIGLPADVAQLTHIATALLVPWPAAIGYRRFYQGILVRHHMPRRVAYGTLVRLVAMSVSAIGLAATTRIPGACIGAVALLTGVVAEAAASRWMARHLVRDLLYGIHPAPRASADAGGTPLTTRHIIAFYYPLALTSLIAIAVNPLVTFFLGRSRSALDSLAVLPVITGFVFLFRSGAIAYQEVVVALLGPARHQERPIARVALVLALASALTLAAILFTPLAFVYFGRIAGLPPELARFAIWPARVLALVPALDYLLTFQRSRLILARQTRVITAAAAIEAGTVSVALVVGIGTMGLVGALAATCALFAGRVAGNLFLLLPVATAGRPAVATTEESEIVAQGEPGIALDEPPIVARGFTPAPGPGKADA